jgi:hypothetical protein
MSAPNTGENNTLYVIQSKIRNSDWGATEPLYQTVRLAHNTVDERQLWHREANARGFILSNPFLKRCLRAGQSQGGIVTLAGYDNADQEFIWEKERGEDWGCLHKISDSEQKLNVAGDGPYNENTPIIQYEYDHGSDHELWKLVKYDPQFGPTDVTYDMDHRTLTLGDPVAAASTKVTNATSAGKVTETATLSTSSQKSVTHSVSESTQDIAAVAVSLGAKISFEKEFEVSTTEQITTTHSTGTTKGDAFSTTKGITVTASVNVTVEPGKTYDVWLMARKCILTMPYTATITRKDAVGKRGKSYTINGTYKHENAYRYDILVTDVADGKPVANAVSSPPIIETKAQAT